MAVDARSNFTSSLFVTVIGCLSWGYAALCDEPESNPSYTPMTLSSYGVGSQPGSEIVDIVFVIDGSGSIDDYGSTAFELEKQGIINCFKGDNAFIPQNGTVAISVVQFSTDAEVHIPLTVINLDSHKFTSSYVLVKPCGLVCFLLLSN